MPLRVYVCGLPPPVDGKWHLLDYGTATTTKCDRCKFCARYVRRRKRKRAEYRCESCMSAKVTPRRGKVRRVTVRLEGR